VDLTTARVIIGDTGITDEELTVLLLRARKLAVNQHFWAPDDNPTEEQLASFYDRYEFEIYDVAKEMRSSDSRKGLTSHTELGIALTWGKTGKESVDAALSAIPPKTYVGINSTETEESEDDGNKVV